MDSPTPAQESPRLDSSSKSRLANLVAGSLLATASCGGVLAFYTSVGYLATNFDDPRVFWKLVTILNFTPMVAIMLTSYDQSVDEALDAENLAGLGKTVMLVRFFVPATVLAASVVGLGLCKTEAALLLTAVVAGLCSGWLYYHSATVQGTVGEGQLKYQYLAIPAANLACALVFQASHFRVDAPARDFQLVCNVQAGMLCAFLIPAIVLHTNGAIDYSSLFCRRRSGAAEGEREPLCEFTPEGQQPPPRVGDGSEYLQFLSSCLCFLPIPILPLVASAELAHHLMQVRLYAEAVGVLLLLARPVVSFAARASYLLVRTVVLALMVYYGRGWMATNPRLLTWVWAVYMASGIQLGGLNDCAAKGTAAEVKAFLRRIRVAHYGGMLLGVGITGAFAFGVYGDPPAAGALLSLRRVEDILAPA